MDVVPSGIPLDTKKNDPYRSLWMVGAALTFPFILASGPIAGYIIGQYILVRQLGLSSTAVLISIGVGFFGSALQVARLIQKIKEYESKNPSKTN